MAKERQAETDGKPVCVAVVLPTRNGKRKVIAEGMFPSEDVARQYAAKKLLTARMAQWAKRFELDKIDMPTA